MLDSIDNMMKLFDKDCLLYSYLDSFPCRLQACMYVGGLAIQSTRIAEIETVTVNIHAVLSY